uniref:Uncharacterized protein n=1 Tax=Daucus carota subsp. sativus TaxID=79200 RepID=A0A164XZK9_DAUCS
MNQEDDDCSWRLFTSEDMIDGYKALKRRKKCTKMNKDVRSSSNKDTSEASPATPCHTSNRESKHVFKRATRFDENNENSPFSVLTNISTVTDDHGSMEQGSNTATLSTRKPCTRTPLSNITNIPSFTNLPNRRDKRKGKAINKDWEDVPLKDWSRNLFEEEFSNRTKTIPNLYDDKDETTAEGGYFSDDGLFDSECSEDDLHGPTNSEPDCSSESENG